MRSVCESETFEADECNAVEKETLLGLRSTSTKNKLTRRCAVPTYLTIMQDVNVALFDCELIPGVERTATDKSPKGMLGT